MTAPVVDGAVVAPGLAERLAAVAAVTAEHRERRDAEAAFPDEALAELRASGLLGLLVPVGYGGLGGTVTDVVEAGIELGRVDTSVAMIFVMHCQQVAALVRHGAPRLLDELLPDVAGGRCYLGSVTTEAGTGGRLLDSESPLARDGDDLLVDRFAPVVTGGEAADGFLLTMLAPDAASPTEVSLVYAARSQLEITRRGGWDPLGMRATHSIPLHLRGRVPAHQMVGPPGGFADITVSVFAPLAHLGWAACWLGTAAAGLSGVLRMLRDPAGRAKFDVGSPLLLSRLSRARHRLDTVRALLDAATRTVLTRSELGTPSVQLQLNALKVVAAEECHRAVDELVEAVGMRHGYLRGSPTRLEQCLRDLRSASLNFHNDRLHEVDGKLALLDPEVRFA